MMTFVYSNLNHQPVKSHLYLSNRVLDLLDFPLPLDDQLSQLRVSYANLRLEEFKEAQDEDAKSGIGRSSFCLF